MKILTVLEFLTVYILGGLGYGGIELLWRGRTHWTMLLTGGLCFVCLYLIENHSRERPLRRCLMSAAVITTLEFLVGSLVNLRLGWNVWDYSGQPANLLGQICLGFSLGWLLLSAPALALCRLLRRLLRRRRLSPR